MKLMTAAQVADSLGCSLRHAYYVMEEMHPINIGRGKVRSMLRVKPQELERWIERRAVKPMPETPVTRKHSFCDAVLIDGKLPNSRQRKLLGLSAR